MNKSIIYVTFCALVFSAGLVAAQPVKATDVDDQNALACSEQAEAVMSIPLESIIRGDAGSKQQVAIKNTVNGQYKVVVIGENQDSVHPATNVIIKSANNSVVVKDIEADSNANKVAENRLEVTNNQVKVLVQLGADKVFSGGVKVELHKCANPTEPAVVKTPHPKDAAVAKTEEKPEVEKIADAGPAALAGSIFGLSALAASTQYYVYSRRARNNKLLNTNR